MERVPKIKLSEAEQKAHIEAERRRRILDMARGEKAVEELSAFLTEQGITEEEWKKAAAMRGQERKRSN